MFGSFFGRMSKEPYSFMQNLQKIAQNKVSGQEFSRMGMFGVLRSLHDLKINKEKANETPAPAKEPATNMSGLSNAIKQLASSAEEDRGNTKQPTLAAAVTEAAKGATDKKSLISSAAKTLKKKDKKPLSLGTAAINV